MQHSHIAELSGLRVLLTKLASGVLIGAPQSLKMALEQYPKLLGKIYKPLAEALVHAVLAARQRGQNSQEGKIAPAPLLVGISGAQGTGKSVLATILAYLLSTGAGLRTAVLTLDDFYLKKADRNRLAATLHPLFQTRGVPGTHDTALLMEVWGALKRGSPQLLEVPIFAKGLDERLAVTRKIELPVELVLLEGWCVGARALSTAELTKPINSLENSEDRLGIWRRTVNERLATQYTPLFSQLQYLIAMLPPRADFNLIFQYRMEQEQWLPAKQRLSRKTMYRFIAHFERITRQLFNDLPRQADAIVQLGATRADAELVLKTD